MIAQLVDAAAVIGDLAAGMMKNKGVAAFVTSIVSKNAPGMLLVRKFRFMPPELAILLPSIVTELSV
jgi:hypothetical protein